MDAEFSPDRSRIEMRMKRENVNVFSRLPTVYAASRRQGQKLLQMGGGLSIVEWRTLWDLHEVGPASIGDLAAIQHADHSLLSRALPEMRRKGLIKMQRDPRDGRQHIVALTDKGRAAFKTADPIMRRRRAALLDVFSKDEIIAFVGLLDRLEDFLRLPVEEIIKEKDIA